MRWKGDRKIALLHLRTARLIGFQADTAVPFQSRNSTDSLSRPYCLLLSRSSAGLSDTHTSRRSPEIRFNAMTLMLSVRRERKHSTASASPFPDSSARMLPWVCQGKPSKPIVQSPSGQMISSFRCPSGLTYSPGSIAKLSAPRPSCWPRGHRRAAAVRARPPGTARLP